MAEDPAAFSRRNLWIKDRCTYVAGLWRSRTALLQFSVQSNSSQVRLRSGRGSTCDSRTRQQRRRLCETEQQDFCYSNSLAPTLSVYPGGTSIKWMDVPRCLSVFSTLFLPSINPSMHLYVLWPDLLNTETNHTGTGSCPKI